MDVENFKIKYLSLLVSFFSLKTKKDSCGTYKPTSPGLCAAYVMGVLSDGWAYLRVCTTVNVKEGLSVGGGGGADYMPTFTENPTLLNKIKK